MNLESLRQKRLNWIEANRENGFEDGIKRLLTDLYPDNAHFIFELLQNAEDAQATEVQFVLKDDAVEFKHNGKCLFSIENVEAITSIGVSTKRDDHTSIGKFGIGFKAVFAYTSNPEIHSGKFHFRIRDLVVPESNGIKKPPMGRGETFFAFPFDNPKKPRDQAVKEIRKGLMSLDHNSLLFLSNICSIKYQLTHTIGHLERIEHKGGHIEIRASRGGKTYAGSHWLRFQKDVKVEDEHGESRDCRVAIAYRLAEPAQRTEQRACPSWMVVPVDRGQVSIFFPAEKETSNLRFHLHAPFASTVARDSVRSCKANLRLRDHLAELTVESLRAIRDEEMLTVGFLGVLPNPTDNLSSFYEPIQKAIVKAFRKHKLTPMKQGGYAAANGTFRGPAAITNVINDRDLALLLRGDHSPPMWVANAPQKNSREDRFLDSLGMHEWGWHELVDLLDPLNYNGDLIEIWIAEKDDQWLMRFYALLGEAYDVMFFKTLDVSDIRIVRVEREDDVEHVTPNEAFFPANEEPIQLPGVRFVQTAVYKTGTSDRNKKFARSFLERAGVRLYDELAEIELILESYARKGRRIGANDHLGHIRRFMSYWSRHPQQSSIFQNKPFLRTHSGQPDDLHFRAHECFLDDPFEDTGLGALFACPEVPPERRKHRLWEKYNEIKGFKEFAKAVGVMYMLEIRESYATKIQKKDFPLVGRKSGNTIDRDYFINNLYNGWYWEGSKYYVGPLEIGSLEVSYAVWKTMCKADPKTFRAVYCPNERQRNKLKSGPSFLINQLKSCKWIPDKDGNLKKPQDLTEDSLDRSFPYDNGNGWLDQVAFGEKARKINEDYISLAKSARKLGFSTVEEAEKMAKIIVILGKKGKSPDELISQIESQEPVFPERPLKDKDRREDKISEAIDDAPEKQRERRIRSVRVTEATDITRVWLESQYTNDQKEMVCQICKRTMPFKKHDGHYYFEAVEILSKKFFCKEHEAQFLALCPLCAAMYKEFVKRDEDAVKDLKEKLLSSSDQEVPLVLGELESSIRFVDTHFQDIKTILRRTNEIT